MANLLSKIWAAMRSRPPDPQTGGRLMFIGPNQTGLYVDTETALMVSAVWACVSVISNSLASSSWNVYGGLRGDGNQTALTGDNINYLLNTRPNPEMTAKRLKTSLMLGALMWGNGYAEIARDLSNRPAEIWPLDPRQADLRRDQQTRELFVAYRGADNALVEIPYDDILHVAGPGITGLLGDSPVARAVRTISLAMAQERYSEVYFGNNTQIGGWLEVPTILGETAFGRLKEQLEAGHKGVKKAFKFAIFEGGAKWHPVETNAEDSQLIEARHLQIEEICRWFSVPPHKIGHLLRATNNNIEHQGLEFSRETLRPWKIEIEQECDYKLFGTRGPKKFIEIDLDWAAEGDFKSRMEGYQIGRAAGIYSVNDVLRKLGENTIGPEGDTRTMNSASVKLEDVGKNLAPAPAPAPSQNFPPLSDPGTSKTTGD